MTNFWRQLKKKRKPILALAPMADVTDAAFRRIIAKYGKPDVFFTEFVSADGLMNEIGRTKLVRELSFTPEERPIVAQLFSANPEKMRGAAAFAASLGFDGIDINMGCPDKGIEKQGAGACLIKNPKLAQEIYRAAAEGAGGLPVSIKTRIGYNKNEIESWIGALLELKPAALTVHLRTRKEMSDVPAHWPEISKVVAMAAGGNTVILGNGDVTGMDDAVSKASEYGVDGVMLGRAIYGNPWLFSGHTATIREKLDALSEHTKLFWELFGPTRTNVKMFAGHTKDFSIMKKHFKAYVSGFPQAAELRAELMSATDAKQVCAVIKRFKKQFKHV